MEIDNLSVSIKVDKADSAVKKILQMADAVDRLAKSSTAVNGDSLKSFASGLSEIKKAVPSAKKTANMQAFASAITEFTNAINGVNITDFANDMSTVSGAVQTVSGKGASNVGKMTKALKTVQEQAKETANAVNEVAKNPAQGSYKVNSQDTKVLAHGFHEANTELSKVAISASSIGGKLSKMGAIVPTKQFKSLSEQADKVKARYEELRNTIAQGLETGKITESSKEYEKQSKELAALRNEYDELILKQKELALAGNGFKLNPTLQAGLDGFKKGFNGVINVVKGGFTSAISSANKHLSSFVKNLTGANSAQKALQKTMSSMKSLPQKIAKEITRLGKMLKLMVVRTALRSVIKEVGNGFKSLAIHSDEFNESMSNMVNASKTLGYSFSAMVSPLINALAPALVYIINLLTKLLNIINQVFSALSGASTWNKAKNFTDSWRDSIKGASGAAKELKKTVLGFDELNQLQDNKNSGGGGSDIADMFETVKIDPKWKDFADWLKEMWKNKDFYDLGKLIGEKLRDTLESIPWDKIRKTSNDLGKALATLINGFVEVERLAYDIGYTVAQGVNTVFEFINGFVHNLHWDSIGKFIANLFNGFFENIDWKLIKDTVITGLKGIADTINSFIDEFHWDNISDFIINGVDTIVSGIKTFFETVKWKELGSKLGEQLQKTIKGINWRDVGIAIGDILQSAIDFVSGFVSQLKVEDIRKALKEMVDGFFDTVDTEELGHTLADILDLIVQVAIGFFQDNGARLAEEGKKLLKGLWDGLDRETITSIGKVIGGVLLAAGLIGFEFMKVSLVAAIAKQGITKLLVNALFGGGGAAAGAGAAGAGAAGGASTELIGSATVVGSSLGTALCVGLITAVGGYALASYFSKELEPIIAENQKVVDAINSGMKETIPTYEEMSQAAREASHNQKEYAEKMQEMYDNLLKTHPELQNLKDKLEDSGVKIGNNVDRLLQINDALNIFREKNGDASATLEELADKYGKVDGKTRDAIDSLGLCEDKYTDAYKVIDDYNKKLEDNEKFEGNLIKVYKDHHEVVQDMKNAHDNVVGSFKTHWDIVNQNKDAQKDYTKSIEDSEQPVTTLEDAIKDLTEVLKGIQAGEKDVEDATPAFNDALKTAQDTMKDTSDAASETGKNIVDGIKQPLEDATFDSESKGLFDSLFGSLEDVFGIASPAKNMYPIGNNILLGVIEGFEEMFGDFTKSITDFYDNYVKTWFDKDTWTFSGVADGLKSTFEDAKNAIKGVWNDIADKMNGEFEIGSAKFKINLPKFAGGGFPAENGIFMANSSELVGRFSNGKTAVANNEQIVQGIQAGVYNAVVSAMSQQSGGQYISNEIILDGEVVARSITKAQEKMNRRYSPQTV